MSKILIVDDSATILSALAAIVRAMKFEPITAESGEKAVELFVAERPSLVLLDVNMPGIDGYETARRIRAEFPSRPTTIVALSGWGQEEDRQRARSAGFDHHLIKPVEIDALQALLRTLETTPA